jgi:hypothetical protein
MPRQDKRGPEYSDLMRFDRNEWVHLVVRATIEMLTAFAVLVLMLVISIRTVGGLEVRGEQIYLGPLEIGRMNQAELSHKNVDPTQKTVDFRVIVESTAGFQNSGLYLRKGDTVSLTPGGRVNLAVRQVLTFTSLAKRLTATRLPNEGYADYREKNPPLNLDTGLTEDNTFRRNWLNPDGEEIDSGDLNLCLLSRDQQQRARWGTLLAQVLEKPGSATADPLQVLRDNNLKPSNLFSVPAPIEHTAERDGWLTFIINDAVISEKAPEKPCRDYYEALKKVSQTLLLQDRDRHKIPERVIPLIWYADNVGSFYVNVRVDHRTQ